MLVINILFYKNLLKNLQPWVLLQAALKIKYYKNKNFKKNDSTILNYSLEKIILFYLLVDLLNQRSESSDNSESDSSESESESVSSE